MTRVRSAIVMALMLVLVAALKRRSAAENQLALLASTDSLTGLSNRRRFDDVFASEWLRAQRTNTQIARQLGLSEGTVRTHLENIYSRLQVSNRTSAVIRAFPDRVA